MESLETVTAAQPERSVPTDEPADDRRELILRSAARLFAEQGYLGTSTTQIAKAVGIRQPTLYHHFRTKADILRELAKQWLGAVPQLAEDLARRRDQDAAARIYALLRSDIEALGHNPYDQRGLWAEHLLHDPLFAAEARQVARWLDAVREIVQQGVEQGTFHPVEPLEVAYLVDGIFYGIARLSRQVQSLDPAARADRLATLVVRGLIADATGLQAARDQGRAICADPAGRTES